MATSLDARELGDQWMTSIYRSYEGRLRKYLAATGTPRDSIEDVIQETSISLIEIARDGAIDDDVDPWGLIRTVARRRWIDSGRRDRRNVPLVDSSDLYGLAALSPDVEEEAALRALVGQCLYELHPLERQALVLHHVQQLTVEEVAVITHRSVDGVRGLLKRGRVRFRVVYERHNDGTLAGVPMLGTLVKHARLARQRAALWVRQRCPDSQIVADLARATIELGAVAALGVASLLSPSTSAVTRASADGTKSSASHPAFIPVAFIHPSPVESDGPGGAKNGRTGRSDPNRPVSTDTRVRVALPTAGAADVAVNPDDGRLVLEVVTSPLGHEIRYLDKTELGCRSAPSVPSPREVSAEAAGSRTSAYCEDD